MFFIRQNATHKVVLGPAVAVGDGFTPVANLDVATSDEAEAILHDNGTVVDISGYTWAAITTADGYYHLTLQSGISGTVGHLTVVVNDDSLCLPLRADFTILEEAVYDITFKAAAEGPLQPTTAGRTLDVNAAGEAGLDFDNTSGTIDAAQLGADCITSAKIADDAISAEHINTGVLTADAFAADALVAATFETGAFTADAFAANALVAATFASDYYTAIESEANDALVAVNLDHLMKTAVANNADMTVEVTDGTVLSNIMSKTSDTSSYAVATDSLEGIADGGGGLTAQNVWEYAGVRNLTSTGLDLVLASSTFALAMADAVWDELLAGHTTSDTAGLVLNEWQDGGRLDLILDAIPTTAMRGTENAALASVFTGMTSLPNWISALATDQTGDVTALTEINAAGGGAGTYVETTDSLEALRNRGDAAWTTGAGGSDRLLMVDTTISGVPASQTEFILAAGSADDDAYNNCTIVIEDVSTATQKAVGMVINYTGATKTVFLKEALAFAIADTDKVYILAENALKSTVANRQLDVTATGAAGIDWANVENQGTAVDLSATDIQLADTTTAVTNTVNANVVSAIAAFFQDCFTVDSGEVSGAEVSGSLILEVAKVVWDRLLQGNTHNIVNSAGRRLRQVESIFVLDTGTAQAGAVGTITLAAGASALDDFYNHLMVVITGGTGIGQARAVNGYNGTTKVATIVPDWVTTPDNTSEYELLADTEKHVYEVHTGAISSGSFAANAIDASAIADDAIDAGSIATGAFTADAFAANSLVAATFATDYYAAVNAEVDTALSDYDGPTNAEMEARTLPAASYFDPANDTVAHVTLCDTITTYTGNTKQTGDNFTRLGAPAGASVSADIAAVKAETATIVTDTNELQTDWTDGGRLDLIQDAILVDTGTTLPASLAALPTAIENADAVLVRGASNVENAADRHSLGALIMIISNGSVSGTILTAKKPSDDSTFAAYTVTVDAGADPITGVE